MVYRIKAICSNARFTLSDLDDDVSSGFIIAMREKAAYPLPLNKYLIDITMKTSSSRKRKTSEATYLNLENLRVEESL